MNGIEKLMAEVQANLPSTTGEMRDVVSALLAASEVTAVERDAFVAGYVSGLSYAILAKGVITDIATECMLRIHESDDDAPAGGLK